MRFRVWAPSADKVEVETRGERHPMARQDDGWWIATQVDARDGDDYQFRVNDGMPLPDPRSSWQPHGVHKASRAVDHSKFQWTDQRFQARPLSAAVIYELHIGTFTDEGTFDSAIQKLDHLLALGVTHVELLPVADFPGERGWGYDGVALFAAKNAYGGPEGLKRLVDACHAKGLAVLLDVVYNHLGPSGNYLGQFGPYFTDRHHTPWGAALNFDGPQSDQVRRFFCDNALMWLRDYHIDGLRLDAVHAIVDTSAIHILEQLATETDELKAHLGRHLVLIAESDLNDPRIVRPWEMGGFGLDAQWSDDIHHSLHSVLTGEKSGYYADFGSIEDLALSMHQPYVYAGRHSSYRQTVHGRPVYGMPGNRFLAYLQNHDQIGNRAKGERISHLVSTDRAKIGAALVLTSVFVPMLFQGEEWGASSPFQYFVDFSDDPDLAAAVTEGRRREFAAFGWQPDDVPDPQDEQTFRRSKLNWSEVAQQQHQELLTWHQQLIALRRQHSSLTDGRTEAVETKYNEDQEWLTIRRNEIHVLCNFSAEQRELRALSGCPCDVLLASKPPVSVSGERVTLAPESVVILGRRSET